MHIPYTFAVPALTLTLLLASCAEETAKGTDANTAPAATITETPMPVDPVQVQPATALVSDPNPAHGAPGHRCEIPVGASLSTAPPPGSPTMAPTQAPVSTQPAPAPMTTAPGMNPPHGQPGHDCNVAVGAPLPK